MPFTPHNVALFPRPLLPLQTSLFSVPFLGVAFYKGNVGESSQQPALCHSPDLNEEIHLLRQGLLSVEFFPFPDDKKP